MRKWNANCIDSSRHTGGVHMGRIFGILTLVFTIFLFASPIYSSDGESENLSQFVRDEGFVLSAVKNELESEIVIRVAVPDLDLTMLEIGNRQYCQFILDEAGSTLTPGQPMVPLIGKCYQISPSKAPVVSLRILRSKEIQLPAPVLPAQEDLAAEDVHIIQSLDRQLYMLDHWYPRQNLQVYDPEILRDVRLLPVAYFPVQVNPVRNTALIIEEAEIVIRLLDEPSLNTLETIGPYSPSFDQLYRAYVTNYRNPHLDITDTGVGTGEHYLFIMPDAYLARCQSFFTWKEQQGFIVDVILLSELSGSTPEDVRDAILDLYNTDDRPVYVSIIGNSVNFPHYTSYDSYMGGYFSDDLFFSQLEGDDYKADVFLSRYPAANPNELTVMLSKIMKYETDPYTGATDHYKTASDVLFRPV